MTIKRLLCCLSPALLLAACGGSGSDTVGAPSSGSYAWVLKANGSTSSLTYGLSLVSASTPGVEFQIESGSAVLTDSRVVSSGSVDASAHTAGPLSPYALVYIIGGDVRRVPLQADGKAPATQVQVAGSTDACTFLTNGNGLPLTDAVDYATPENSVFIVTTAGADGLCGTSDDGQAAVQLDGTTGGLTYTELSAGAPLAMFRNATSFAPAGWIYTTGVWYSNGGGSVIARPVSTLNYTDAVGTAGATALMDDGTELSVLDLSTSTPAETLLDSSITGGGGWNLIGFDASAWYVYANTSDTSGTWTVLQITRSSPVANVLATGAGEVSVASMGTGMLYVTVLGSSGNSLLAVSKTLNTPVQTLDSASTTTLTTVQTSASGVHELWRITNADTSTVNYELEFINEAGDVVYLVNAGAKPMLSPDATNISFDLSENRTRFIYANGYGIRGFGDAQLVGYDAATQQNILLGTLPGSATFGTQTVYASVNGGPGDLMGGYAASSADGAVSATGSQVFSFNFPSANSLKLTTQAQ